MQSEVKLIGGAMVMLALSASALVVLPLLQVAQPAPRSGPYFSPSSRIVVRDWSAELISYPVRRSQTARSLGAQHRCN